mmetsp:Transcript_49397/g.139905  ORF Transcript_49397/g.139905 Transcript_49397/m.139905 type:complete len:212 (+) Transcript_49397:938-1573(+)
MGLPRRHAPLLTLDVLRVHADTPVPPLDVVLGPFIALQKPPDCVPHPALRHRKRDRLDCSRAHLLQLLLQHDVLLEHLLNFLGSRRQLVSIDLAPRPVLQVVFRRGGARPPGLLGEGLLLRLRSPVGGLLQLDVADPRKHVRSFRSVLVDGLQIVPSQSCTRLPPQGGQLLLKHLVLVVPPRHRVLVASRLMQRGRLVVGVSGPHRAIGAV